MAAFGRRLTHHVKRFKDEVERDSVVKQVRHAVDENMPGLLPRERSGQALREQANVVGIGCISDDTHSPQARVEGEHVAVVASWRDARAAGHRIPRLVRPLDCRGYCRSLSL